MKKATINLLLIAGIAGVVTLFGCNNGSGYSSYGGGSSVTPSKPAPNTVVIANFAFGPATMTVAKGTTVTWQNNDNVAHTATSDNGKWDTGTIGPGGSGSVKFDSAGTWAYHCAVHPMMTASVVVQ